MHCICDNGIWHNSFCQSRKFLLKSLVYLCPRQWSQDYQLCRQLGPLRKVMSPFLSTFFSTGNMGLLPGAVSTLSQALLLKTLPLCLDWQLALSMMSEWEQCLLWELEIGVQCRQREHSWVSSCNNNYSVQLYIWFHILWYVIIIYFFHIFYIYIVRHQRHEVFMSRNVLQA